MNSRLIVICLHLIYQVSYFLNELSNIKMKGRIVQGALHLVKSHLVKRHELLEVQSHVLFSAMHEHGMKSSHVPGDSRGSGNTMAQFSS